MPCRPARGPRGKLRAVARAWATGRGGDGIDDDGDPVTAAAREWIEAREERLRGGGRGGVPEIGPDEIGSVTLFLGLATQWHWHNFGAPGASKRTGLNYGAIASVAEPLGITVDARMLSDLRVMEVAALSAWSK